MEHKTVFMLKKHHEELFCIFNIAVALLAGAYIYVRISQDSYFGNWICGLFPILRATANSPSWTFLRNWGGDFLWAYALFFILYLSMRTYPHTKLRALALAAMVSVFVESLQLIRIDFIKCGTFDFLDILIEFVAICSGAAALSCYQQIRKGRRKNRG